MDPNSDDPRDPDTGFFEELRRRRVVRAVVTYAAAAFVTLEAADLVLPALGAPEGAYRFIVIAAIVGLPLTGVLSWIFDVSSEGLRLEGRPGEAGALVAPGRSLLLYGGLAGLVTVAGVAAALWLRPGTASGEVAVGADVIAVLPFHASGSDIGLTGEGMVDLLSGNLNQVGAIRTVDSRTVLYRWSRRAREGALPLDSALALAGEVGAGSVLTGSITGAGSSVRLQAELHGIDGTPLATARVDGASDRILALVDSLSVELLRGIWRSTRLLPSVSVSAVTSGDLGAVRAFLEGERHYRSSWWDAALASYREAVEADSTFGLAHFRLAYVAGWAAGSSELDSLVERSLTYSSRFADALPPRERLLIRAQVAREEEGWEPALEILRDGIRRFPDDPEMHHFFNDVRYHLETEGAGPDREPVEEALRHFDRAIALDPSFTPAFIHPLEVVFAREDTARIAGYLGRLRQATERNRLAIRIYDAGLEAVTEPGDPRTLMTALALTFEGREEALGTLAWQAAEAVGPSLERIALRLPAADRAALERWLDSRRRKEARAHTAAEIDVLLTLAGGGGEVERVREIFRDAVTAELAPNARTRIPLALGYLGYLDPADVVPEHSAPTDRRALGMVELVQAFDAGDADAARSALRAFEEAGGNAGSATRAGGEKRDALAEAGRGLVRVAEGDTVRGLLEMGDALEPLDMIESRATEALWFRWAATAALHPETRERALEILARPWPGSPLYEPLRLFHLGRGLESAGRSDEAADAYARFARVLDSADSDLLIQGSIAEARREAGAGEDAPR